MHVTVTLSRIERSEPLGNPHVVALAAASTAGRAQAQAIAEEDLEEGAVLFAGEVPPLGLVHLHLALLDSDGGAPAAGAVLDRHRHLLQPLGGAVSAAPVRDVFARLVEALRLRGAMEVARAELALRFPGASGAMGMPAGEVTVHLNVAAAMDLEGWAPASRWDELAPGLVCAVEREGMVYVGKVVTVLREAREIGVEAAPADGSGSVQRLTFRRLADVWLAPPEGLEPSAAGAAAPESESEPEPQPVREPATGGDESPPDDAPAAGDDGDPGDDADDKV